MKKTTLRKRFRYWLDIRMAKGTASMVKLLLVMVLTSVAFVTTLVLIFHLHAEGKSPLAVLWDNLRSAMSSSFPASDSGTILYIALYTLLGLTGMVFTGMLIGIFSSAMRGKIIALQQDNPEIIEQGHTVILGFRIGEYALLKEMIANAENEKRTYVVVENMERQEIEQAIRKNVKIPKNIRLISIKADTTSPTALSCCAIPECSTVVVHTREKGRTVKTLLALQIMLANRKQRPRIVASVDANNQVFSRDVLKENDITMLHSGDVVARIIAHSTTQPGIYEALLDMIDFQNFEFYFESTGLVIGLPFGAAVLAARKAIVVGIYRNNQALINPPADTLIELGDLLIVFEEEPGDLILDKPAERTLPELQQPLEVKPIKEVVIFGINSSITTILHELPDNIETIKLIGLSSADFKSYIAENEEFVSEITTDYRNTESDRILADMLKKTEHVCLLSDRKKKEEDSDTETMLRIIRLRNIKKKYQLAFTITAEMRCENNRNLISIEDSEDFVVATDLSSMMLAQVTTEIKRAEIFSELLDERGSEAYLKPASDFEVAGLDISYGELQKKVYATGSILMGLRTAEEPFKIIANSDQLIHIGENDRLILIGED
jgi:Trk K+ transport system NAD-binding subunit